MKAWQFLIVISTILFTIQYPVDAQVAPNTNASAQNQWLSHQMNQPRPDSDKFSVSDEIMDDIQKLYLDAKAEADSKPKQGNIPKPTK